MGKRVRLHACMLMERGVEAGAALSEAAGEAMARLLEQNLRPSDILTKKAFENAMVTIMALGGQSRTHIHTERERERDRDTRILTYIHECVCIIYLSIYGCIYMQLH
jgi:hypothetical protein